MSADDYEDSVAAQATAVLEDDDAPEKAQRGAARRLRRLRGRAPELGVGAFDFDLVPSAALRIYYSSSTSRADPTGDNDLVETMSDPLAATPDTTLQLARLLRRPHLLLKVNTSPSAFRPDGSTAFHVKRRPEFSATRGRETDDPFEEDDSVVLFDDATGRAVARARVVGLARARTYDAASGTLALALAPLQNNEETTV